MPVLQFLALPLGVLSFLFCFINLLRTLSKRNKGWQVLMFASLSCGMLTMLSEHGMIYAWVAHNDMSALLDVVPFMNHAFTGMVLAEIILNGIVLVLNLLHKEKKPETNQETRQEKKHRKKQEK